jgi:hypothetical protein
MLCAAELGGCRCQAQKLECVGMHALRDTRNPAREIDGQIADLLNTSALVRSNWQQVQYVMEMDRERQCLLGEVLV